MLLITTPSNDSEVLSIRKTADAMGWNVFSSNWRIPEHLVKQPGAVYGEMFFCECIAEQMNWNLVANPIDWIARLPEEYVSRKIDFMTLGEASEITAEKFVMPADHNSFKGKVYSSGASLPINRISQDTKVLVSDPMIFTSEYRCFVRNDVVITASCYLYKDSTWEKPAINDPKYYNNNNDAVIEFVTELIRDQRVNCASSCVIDVGRFKKDTYAVIESNPVYASGIYGCELVAVLDAIKSSCIS